MKYILIILALLMLMPDAFSQDLYSMRSGISSRVSSFENLNGRKGEGGKTNKSAKGNAFEWLYPGGKKELLNINGKGIIQRIWLTVNQSPHLLKSLRLQMFWDGSSKAAVDVPLGDFFVSNLGNTKAFQSALFSSPEGRSFNSYVPMPFQTGARLLISNESATDSAKLFFDVDYILTNQLPLDALYFHAYFSRQKSSSLGKDFQVLPTVYGKGRFLGMSVGLITDSSYNKTWWGEGEVKMYIDGDSDYPTINGTGAEDYVGTGWGMGPFNHLYQGAPVASEENRQFVFYRWHVPDIIWFDNNLQVTLQQIGGGTRDVVSDILKKGAKLIPISVDNSNGFVRLLDMETVPSIFDSSFPDGWVNFYRVDDYSAVSYFYLNSPTSNLPALLPLEDR